MGATFFFFFFEMSTQEGRVEIRTCDLHFMRRGPNRLNYLLETGATFKVWRGTDKIKL
jgi:hypothetical protein